jgi:cyclopropane-fatty-acyl-phospholipid synthase
MDSIFQLMLEDKHPDITNSWPGDYGPPTLDNLKKAQRAKHEHYLKLLDVKEGDTVLDIGCGWGPMMEYCRERNIQSVGLTLSSAQYEYLRKKGFDVHLCSWEAFKPKDPFDAAWAIGSAEHFCSAEKHLSRGQEQVYRVLFQKICSWLKPGGTFGGQVMTFNGNMPDYGKFRVEPREPDSRYYHYALLECFYPGSWLPRDFDHFYEAGRDWFEVIDVIDGRAHYVWTMSAWGEQFRKPLPLGKWPKVTWLVLRSLLDKNFKYWARAFWERSNKRCFQEGWMGHEFFFLRKKSLGRMAGLS